MDLTRQPPRRPSNANVAGITGLARMIDKARGHNNETIGEFKYGADSGLDVEVLEFINMGVDEFAEAADEMDDEALGVLASQKAKKSQDDLDAYNKEHLEREPQVHAHAHERHRDERVRVHPRVAELGVVVAHVVAAVLLAAGAEEVHVARPEAGVVRRVPDGAVAVEVGVGRRVGRRGEEGEEEEAG